VPESSVNFRLHKNQCFYNFYVLIKKLKSINIVKTCLMIKSNFLARKFATILPENQIKVIKPISEMGG
jgi:hypothetical protein